MRDEGAAERQREFARENRASGERLDQGGCGRISHACRRVARFPYLVAALGTVIVLVALPVLANECGTYRYKIDVLNTAVGLDAINHAIEEVTDAGERADASSRAGRGMRPESRDIRPALRASVLAAKAAGESYRHLAALADVFDTAGGPGAAEVLSGDMARAMDASRKARVVFHELLYYLHCFD